MIINACKCCKAFFMKCVILQTHNHASVVSDITICHAPFVLPKIAKDFLRFLGLECTACNEGMSLF